MPFLIGVFVFIGFFIFVYLYVRRKIKNYFGYHLEEIIEKGHLEDEEVPKSLSSMDSIYLDQIRRDFPDLNINELKRMSEKIVIDCYMAIDEKDCSNMANDKIKSFVLKKISEDDNTVVKHDQFKIHQTVISKYIKSKGVATIYFSSNFEYIYCKNGISKKVQDRARVEFIYVIDESFIKASEVVIGLHCPNCGSPITSLGDKRCSYCGGGVVDIVKKTWICNDIVVY